MVGNAKISPMQRPAQLNGFEDVWEAGKSIFDEWISGKGKTDEKQLLEAQLAAQKSQLDQVTSILKVALIGAVVVLGVKYVSGK